MTQQEQQVMDISADLWNAFLGLEELHQDNTTDFRFHIHALQAIVASRDFIKQQKHGEDKKL